MYDVLKLNHKTGLNEIVLQNVDYPTAWEYVTKNGGEIWHGIGKVIVISKTEFNKRYKNLKGGK